MQAKLSDESMYKLKAIKKKHSIYTLLGVYTYLLKEYSSVPLCEPLKHGPRKVKNFYVHYTVPHLDVQDYTERLIDTAYRLEFPHVVDGEEKG